MYSLTAIGKREKNALSTGSAFLLLVEIQLDTAVYICYNTENIVWNGHTWIAFPMDIGDNTEDVKGSDPNVKIKISNEARVIQQALEENGGGVGVKTIIRVVNSLNLSSTECDLEMEFVVTSCTCNSKWAEFTLGTEYSARTVRPLYRYMKDFCPLKYKGVRCGYNGNLATCNKTLVDCRNHSNSARFGGFPGIDQKGVYK